MAEVREFKKTKESKTKEEISIENDNLLMLLSEQRSLFNKAESNNIKLSIVNSVEQIVPVYDNKLIFEKDEDKTDKEKLDELIKKEITLAKQIVIDKRKK